MNNNDKPETDLGAELRAMIPAPGGDYWDRIDNTLEAAATQDHYDVASAEESETKSRDTDLQVVRLMDMEPRRNPTPLIASLAAAILLVVGIGGFLLANRASDDANPDLGVTADTESEGEGEVDDNNDEPEPQPDDPSAEGDTDGDTDPAPSPVAPSSDRHFVLSDGVLFGEWTGTEWVPATLGPDEALDAQTLTNGTAETAPLNHSPFELCWTGDRMAERFTDVDGTALAEGVSLTDPTWELRPRTEIENGRNETHVAAVQMALANAGVPDELTRDLGDAQIEVRRIDFDGDGFDELLVQAWRGPDDLLGSELGDFAVTLVLQVPNGTGEAVASVLHVDATVETDDLTQNKTSFNGTYLKVIERRTFNDAIDLNGDGSMELIVTGQAYESWSTYVYDLSSLEETPGTIEPQLVLECGA